MELDRKAICSPMTRRAWDGPIVEMGVGDYGSRRRPNVSRKRLHSTVRLCALSALQAVAALSNI
jgi:hypothetical protein